MGRPKTAACTLEVSVEEIRNLPKVNKGSGGADPYAVLEILDSGGLCLVGGDRELYCKGCKTKVMKKSLDGYVNERFELGGEESLPHFGRINVCFAATCSVMLSAQCDSRLGGGEIGGEISSVNDDFVPTIF
jgi:hypothetical protein